MHHVLVQRKDWYTFAQLPQAYACSKILRYLYDPMLPNLNIKLADNAPAVIEVSKLCCFTMSHLCAAYTHGCSM